ncbi:ArsR/SmtB family transcription factor [Cytobacillus oceanisediminis]|uniref:ArsR/SmtB family transcription factor n=1 Tax=Cytobacillus oceanisediminis TaxID=665099 RepID=UPI0030D23C00
MPVGDIAEQLQLLQPAASKHLRVLHNAGLAEVEAVANQRIYRLRHQSFQDLDNWIESFKHVW